MFWKKKKSANIVGDSWAVYSYSYGEGQRAVISFDVERAREENHKGYSHSIRVIIRIPLIGRVLENGLPVREELPRLQQLEDDLLHLLEKRGASCRFVGRMTYGGMREFVFQVEDVETFRTTVSRLEGRVGGYEIELREGERWQFFDEKVRPKPVFWQQISDYKVIEKLIEAGSNPKSLHLIEHTIVGEDERLLSIRDELKANGFTEVCIGDGKLVMGKESRLGLEEIFCVTGKLFSYCETVGVKYDGWGVAVVK
jgi:regulator of RNase E activity RraB